MSFSSLINNIKKGLHSISNKQHNIKKTFSQFCFLAFLAVLLSQPLTFSINVADKGVFHKNKD